MYLLGGIVALGMAWVSLLQLLQSPALCSLATQRIKENHRAKMFHQTAQNGRVASLAFRPGGGKSARMVSTFPVSITRKLPLGSVAIPSGIPKWACVPRRRSCWRAIACQQSGNSF